MNKENAGQNSTKNNDANGNQWWTKCRAHRWGGGRCYCPKCEETRSKFWGGKKKQEQHNNKNINGDPSSNEENGEWWTKCQAHRWGGRKCYCPKCEKMRASILNGESHILWWIMSNVTMCLVFVFFFTWGILSYYTNIFDLMDGLLSPLSGGLVRTIFHLWVFLSIVFFYMQIKHCKEIKKGREKYILIINAILCPFAAPFLIIVFAGWNYKLNKDDRKNQKPD